MCARLSAATGIEPGDGAVAEVVASCGYLPLAISLMAGQLKHHASWTSADLAADLASATGRLSRIAAENASVSAAFDLSYQNLSTDLQVLFRRLGLHPGVDFDAYAAAALDGADLGTTRGRLDDLFSYHLIDEPARGRYRFHDLVREHASSLAATDPPDIRAAALSRLLDYYLHTALSADLHLTRRTPTGAYAAITALPAHAPDLTARDAAVAWMDAEHLNVSAVAGHASAHGRLRHAIAIPAAMHAYLQMRGHLGEASVLHQAALKAARETGDQPAAAGALNDLGHVQYLTMDFTGATATFNQALNLSREAGDRLGEANALAALGALQESTGDLLPAMASISEAMAMYRAAGDRLGEARINYLLGGCQYLTGHYAEAIRSQAAALDLYTDLGNKAGQADALSYLGAVQHAMADYPAAAVSNSAALALYQSLGDQWNEAGSLLFLANVQRSVGEYSTADGNLNRALELYRDFGDRFGEASVLKDIAAVRLDTKDIREARASLDLALEIYTDLKISIGIAETLIGLGVCQRMANDLPGARASLDRALALCQRIGEQRTDQDDELRAEFGEAVDKLTAEAAPAHVRLDAVHEHQVAVSGVLLGHEQPGGRPDQPLGPALGNLRHRPGDLEVVVILGIDGTNGCRLPCLAQVADHPAGCFASIVPALEGRDDHW